MPQSGHLLLEGPPVGLDDGDALPGDDDELGVEEGDEGAHDPSDREGGAAQDGLDRRVAAQGGAQDLLQARGLRQAQAGGDGPGDAVRGGQGAGAARVPGSLDRKSVV